MTRCPDCGETSCDHQPATERERVAALIAAARSHTRKPKPETVKPKPPRKDP